MRWQWVTRGWLVFWPWKSDRFHTRALLWGPTFPSRRSTASDLCLTSTTPLFFPLLFSFFRLKTSPFHLEPPQFFPLRYQKGTPDKRQREDKESTVLPSFSGPIIVLNSQAIFSSFFVVGLFPKSPFDVHWKESNKKAFSVVLNDWAKWEWIPLGHFYTCSRLHKCTCYTTHCI